MKKMFLANFNLTFGLKEEPLLKWLDEFVIPALNSGIRREMSDKRTMMFENVKIEELEKDNLILTGILIKDTVIDIYNQYTEDSGLVNTDEHHKSAPYSSFIIFLHNHRMVLVKRQSESPDLRSFSSTLMEILKKYRANANEERKKANIPLLPYAINGIKGIKDEKDISKALESVKKIKKLTLKLLPLNNEWGGWDGLIDGIDEQIRRESGSKTVKVIVSSPQSKAGVEKIIKETNGLLQTELDVEYFSDDIDEEGKERKNSGKIKDNQMQQAMDVDFPDELQDATEVIYQYCKAIPSLNVETTNIIDYRAYLAKRRR
ncbi:MAG: hypothetical protein HFG46_06785 [Clostridium sp.]|jgi:hypothetical protein|nr:hypothetical protein [Clostridium sp.]